MTKTKSSELAAISDRTLELPESSRLSALVRAIDAAGGRGLIVGGWVRDRLLGIDSKDIDLEVFGLEPEDCEQVLGAFGEVIHVGRAFGVMRVKGFDVDVSLPRYESRGDAGPDDAPRAHGHPELEFAVASRRRDLTINSMAWDPLSGELLDPHAGRHDLERGVLRATDVDHFGDDPLRGLRVAQFMARFDMQPDAELVRLCRAQDLSAVAPERIFDELCKLLMKSDRPSDGLDFLRTSDLIRFLPELESLIDVPQDPEWHPEGDVWTHTLMVVDVAARLRLGGEGDEGEDLALMLGALLHDLGKVHTTRDADGRIRSLGHDQAGGPISEAFLGRMRASKELVRQVVALVQLHLAPFQLDQGGAKPPAYRRLARKLVAASVSMELLERVARADHLGRTTPDAIAGRCDELNRFLVRAGELSAEERRAKDVVLGRHVVARGIAAGPEVGRVLERCREVQDETGWRDAEAILDKVLDVGVEAES